MISEDRLKHIIAECVQDVLNENFTCRSMSTIWDMYLKLNSWQKIDCDLKGYDEFKEALNVAVNKLGKVVQRLRYRQI